MKTREWLWLAPALLASFAVAHWLTLRAYPAQKMQEVIDRTGRNGERENTLVHGRPVTPESRNVVRPSPDLVYSICVYDLDGGPVDIEMTRFDAYHSLSLYDARTNNYFTLNDTQYDGDAKAVRIAARAGDGRSGGGDASGRETVVSPTRQGVALIRRLAAPELLLERALEIRQRDSCRPAAEN
jgi:uncharacterized membrane protein